MTDKDSVLCTDERTRIQAQRRLHATRPPAAGEAMRVEHEHHQMGAWTYFAAWDVRRAKIFGRCERRGGVAPFQRLVEQVIDQKPYRSAERVFWIMDNGSAHRGQRSDLRLPERWPTIVPVHTPVHDSWLNQVEVYFSIVQRKVLTPNDFPALADLERQLSAFERHYEFVAKPFEWKFTRAEPI